VNGAGNTLAVTGRLYPSASASYNDIFIRRYSGSGSSYSASWTKSIGGSVTDEGFGVALDAAANVYATGFFGSASVDFNPGGTPATLSNSSNGALYLAKYNGSGVYQYAKSIGTNVGGQIIGLASTSDGSAIYISGSFNGTVNFNSCGGSFNLTASSDDAFFAKYAANPVSSTAQGPATVCSSGNTITLQNAPAGAAVTWTATSGLTPSSGSGTSATVSAVSGFSGNGSVTFNISGTCGNTTAKKDVWVSISGKPNLTFYGTVTSTVTCAYNTFQVSASASGNPDPYGWSWNVTGGTLINGQGSSTVTIQAPGPGQGIYIEVGALNACGYSYYRHTLEAVSEYGGQYCFQELTAVRVSRNPAADYVDVDPNASLENNPVRQEHYQVNLYDKYGQEVTRSSTKKKGEKLRLNVKPYPEGLYFLRVTYSGGIISKQLVIKR
jgi:hypothetical protein